MPGVKKITSSSDISGSLVLIYRNSGYSLDALYRDVKNRMDSLTGLPALAEEPIITQEIYNEHAITVQVHGDADEDVLQETARRLRRQLLQNPAIELVNTIGNRRAEIIIEAGEAALQAHGYTLESLGDRIRQASLREPGGELYSRDGMLIIKADQQRYRQRDFEEIVLEQWPNGGLLKLKDIAEVKDGYEQYAQLSRYNGEPSIVLNVKMYSNSDIMAISEQVDTELEKFRAGQLPQGIALSSWNDQSDYIINRLSLLLDNSLLGILLVLGLLALFLELRIAFWVAAGLPVTFAGALLMMDPALFDMTLNELTTFGFIIALGIVVDDAVVVGESVHSAQRRYGHTLAATTYGVQRVALPTVYGVLTTMVAFLSLSLVEGEMGKIFSFFSLAAAFCLGFSLLETKLVLPAHLAGGQKRKTATNPVARLWRGLQKALADGLNALTRRIYRPLMHRLLNYRYASLFAAIGLLILVGGMIPSGKIRAVFFPDIPGNNIHAQLTLQNDAGYGISFRQAALLEQAARETAREIEQEYDMQQALMPHIQVIASDKSVDLLVGLPPEDQRPLSTPDIVARWQEKLPPLEGVQQLKFIITWEDDADISIELHAQSRETLAAAGRELEAVLADFPSIDAIGNSLRAGQKRIDLKLKPEGEALGLTQQALARQVQHAFQGYELQRFQRGKDEIRLKLRYPAEDRSRLSDLDQAHIRTPDGQTLPLDLVAEQQSRYETTYIERINGSRVALLTADVDKTQNSPEAILEILQEEYFPQLLKRYPDLRLELGGESSEEAETQKSLQKVFLLALLAIYALLAIPLKSYLQPLLIMSAIPFGIAGALLGHWLHDLPFSLLSIFGMLALSGVVINDSLLLISQYNRLREQQLPPRYAMVSAAASRLRAILLTSLTTFAGLVPLISESSEQAQVLIPAAVALGYGILFATLITLILIPTLVVILEDFKPRRRHHAPMPDAVLET